MLQFFLILLALIYFLSPIDLFPDAFPLVGRVDDLLLFAYIYWNFFRKRRPSPSSSAGSNRRGEGRRQEGTGAHAGASPSAGNARRARDPYEILQIDRSADMKEIKRAYHEQANRYHPDKVSHLGEEFQALAKEKFQEIQWAYETLSRRRQEGG